ncbi:MAG TPA: hypothetical protein RMG95_18215, partial [Polyangiaceae bacterium LLY-WYZ-15_(1-7)]|nr:hypothetical protein [Polyangiaceae bacterium LLY-WYZ-15_(1-7)]
AAVTPDAGPACVCEPAVCVVGACLEGRCRRAPEAAGVACGEAGRCVEGGCVEVFGCGDGFRESGDDGREGCDDGNLVGGDGCDARCAPEPLVLAAAAPVVPATDRWGWTLFVWSEPIAGGWAVRAQRHHRLAGPMAPFTIREEPGGVDPAPEVRALAEGWVVAHRTADEDEGDLFLTRVGHGAVLERRALRRPGAQGAPALLPWDRAVRDDVALVFLDETQGRAVFQRLGEALRPSGEARFLSPSATGLEGRADAPRVAGEGRNGVVVWTASEAGTPVIWARALRDGVPGPLRRVGEGFAADVAAEEAGEGWLVAHGERASDPRGDVALARLDADARPVAQMPLAAGPEAERGPRLASAAGAALVLFERGSALTGVVRDLGVAMTTPVPELEVLASALAADGRQTRPRVAAAEDGFWITWLDDADRAVAFRLPAN